MYKIYRHTSPSGKAYIGVTQQVPTKRWQRGLGYKQNIAFYRAIQKYGWDNITHEILETVETKEEAEKREMELIKTYDLTNPEKGYNLQYGGNVAGTKTEEEKEQMRIRNSGENSLWYGKPSPFRGTHLKEEHKRKISESRKGKCAGEKNHNYKRTFTEEERELRASYRKGKSEAQRAMEKCNAKKVRCIDTGIIYKSKGEASRATNTNNDSIRKCCNGERKTANGFKWEWVKQ